jgi:acetyl-CoA acetyltransferase family protein
MRLVKTPSAAIGMIVANTTQGTKTIQNAHFAFLLNRREPHCRAPNSFLPHSVRERLHRKHRWRSVLHQQKTPAPSPTTSKSLAKIHIPPMAYLIGSTLGKRKLLDGLEDAYEPGRSMGTFGEDCAAKYSFTRAEQDAFAIASVERAKAATTSGAFQAEITPVTVKTRAGETVVSVDEGPGKVKLDKVTSLKPAFKKDGTITAASSSSINDGAAALVMMRQSTADKLGCKPLARIVSHATHAQEPEWFATAPVGATQKALAKAGWQVSDVDLWEVNEAFAVVPMALMKELQVPHHKVNVNGGACALGHPIGASGARIMVTLIHALKARGLKKGLATLCIGGGEGTAVALEIIKRKPCCFQLIKKWCEMPFGLLPRKSSGPMHLHGTSRTNFQRRRTKV